MTGDRGAAPGSLGRALQPHPSKKPALPVDDRVTSAINDLAHYVDYRFAEIEASINELRARPLFLAPPPIPPRRYFIAESPEQAKAAGMTGSPRDRYIHDYTAMRGLMLGSDDEIHMVDFPYIAADRWPSEPPERTFLVCVRRSARDGFPHIIRHRLKGADR